MPTVRAITSFYDLEAKQARQGGSEWQCEDKRAASLEAYGLVEIVGGAKKKPAKEEPVVEEPAAEEPAEAEEPKPEPKKRTRKKAE